MYPLPRARHCAPTLRLQKRTLTKLLLLVRDSGCGMTSACQLKLYPLLLAAQAALPGWSGLPGHVRARHLYSIARHLQKHHRLMAVVESLDNGKSVRETRYNSDAHYIWTYHSLTRV